MDCVTFLELDIDFENGRVNEAVDFDNEVDGLLIRSSKGGIASLKPPGGSVGEIDPLATG